MEQYDDVDILIRDSGAGHLVDLRLRSDDDAGEAFGCKNIPVHFDVDLLRAITLDPHAYSQALSAMFFADERLRYAWALIEGFNARGKGGLRVRLHIDGIGKRLQTIRWETLRAPWSELPWSLNDRMLFARFLSPAQIWPARLPLIRQLRCAIIVALPTDCERYGFAAFDPTPEIEHARRACDGLEVAVVAREAQGTGVTLDRVIEALRAGPHLVYLICHGGLHDGKDPFVLLEDEAGRSKPVMAEEFALRVKQLKRQPVLLIVTACHGAGHIHGVGALDALGPQLVQAGVSAVVGMQDEVPVTLLARLIPPLLAEVRQHGYIDRALTVARGAIREHDSWWSPVLFTRLEHGRVCRVDGQMLPAPQPGLSLDALGLLLNEWKIVHSLSQELYIEMQPIKRLIAGRFESITAAALAAAEEIWVDHCGVLAQAARQQLAGLQVVSHAGARELVAQLSKPDNLLELLRAARPGDPITLTELKNSYTTLSDLLVDLLRKADEAIIEIARQLQLGGA